MRQKYFFVFKHFLNVFCRAKVINFTDNFRLLFNQTCLNLSKCFLYIYFLKQ